MSNLIIFCKRYRLSNDTIFPAKFEVNYGTKHERLVGNLESATKHQHHMTGTFVIIYKPLRNQV